MKKIIFTIICVVLICISDGLISAEEDNLNTYRNENDIPTESEQLRLFLLKGYTSARSVIDDVKIEYQTTRIPVNLPPINIPNLPERFKISDEKRQQTSTSVCEYIQKNNKERWCVLNVSIGKAAPEVDLSYRAELVRTEDSPHFKVFDGQCILDYMCVNDSFTSVGRAILELNKTGFFESTDLLSERAPVRFFGYWQSLMPDNVLSSPRVDIETKPEKIGELLTYKVSAVFERENEIIQKISYWLSPERSCLPVKTEVWRNGRSTSRLETKEFIELEDGRWVIKSILQRNYINTDGQEEPQELVNFLYIIRKIELHPEIDEDEIFNTSPDSLPEGAHIVDNRFGNSHEYIKYPAAMSLLEKPLPELKDLNVSLSNVDFNDKMILVCFFEIEQLPSRKFLLELNKRTEELKEKEIAVIAVQASRIDENTLNKLVKGRDISFLIANIEADEEKTLFNWGVKSLPWLILTDTEHVVTAEGFSINELDKKIQ